MGIHTFFCCIFYTEHENNIGPYDLRNCWSWPSYSEKQFYLAPGFLSVNCLTWKETPEAIRQNTTLQQIGLI